MNNIKANKKGKLIAGIILWSITLLWLLPLIWLFATSFKTQNEVASNPISLIPLNPTLVHYRTLFTNDDAPVLRWLLNSFVIASIHTILYLIVASFAAYAFSILKFKYKNIIFAFLLATTMIPSVINLVPLITMMIDLNWYNTWLSLIIPGLGGVFGMFLMRQFFISIPEELVDSAKIDGLGHFGVFFKIVLPLSKPAIMVAGLLAFMGNWNDYMWPQIMMSGATNKNMWTLPHGLATLVTGQNYVYGLDMAAAVIAVLPVLIVYFFVQEHIIDSVARTGIK